MTLTDQVAAIFEAHPNRWINGHEFAQVGGYAGWSARIRELRRKRGWVIENRTRRCEFMGNRWTETEYRYLPAEDVHAEAS